MFTGAILPQPIGFWAVQILKRNGNIWHFSMDKAGTNADNNPNNSEGPIAVFSRSSLDSRPTQP